MALQCDSKHKCITHFTPAFQCVCGGVVRPTVLKAIER